MGGNRLRVVLDRVLEGRLGFVPLALHELQGPEVTGRDAAGRVGRERQLVLGSRGVEVFQSRERIALEYLRIDALRIQLERAVRTRFRILE